jgi:hypothetical protein
MYPFNVVLRVVASRCRKRNSITYFTPLVWAPNDGADVECRVVSPSRLQATERNASASSHMAFEHGLPCLVDMDGTNRGLSWRRRIHGQ